jgi:hypothetical protein
MPRAHRGPSLPSAPRRAGALLAATALVLGCSAVAPPADTTLDSAEAPSPTVVPDATLVPTPKPTPTPRPQAQIEVTGSFVRAWKDTVTEVIEYQVVVVVRNAGTIPADFGTSNRTYRVLDSAGTVVEEGAFTYAFPPVIEPGASAFFVDANALREGVAPEACVSVEPEITAIAAREPVPLYTTKDVSVAAAEVGQGVVARGTVTNQTARDGVAVVVGAVLYDAKDVVVGGLLDNFSISGLAAGTSAAFETRDLRTPPLAPDKVARIDLIAYDAGL